MPDHIVESSIISIDSNIQTTSSGRSLMYSKKSVGPKIQPWGIPALNGHSCEHFPFRTTWTSLLSMEDEIKSLGTL